MGRTRTYTLKLRTQCRTCGELHETTCSLGHNTLCKRQNVKKCQDYRRPSVLEAAVQLATVAGIDLATL